jgi:hypothetical protein
MSRHDDFLKQSPLDDMKKYKIGTTIEDAHEA